MPQPMRPDAPRQYRTPAKVERMALAEALRRAGREPGPPTRGEASAAIYYAGDPALLARRRAVSVIGSRAVSDAGRLRAARLARELAEADVLVVSGLARGVDTAALATAIACGARTMAVIGTPLDRATPAENSALQEQIHREHLLVSPFAIGEPVLRTNFPVRNRLMAALSDASVIVEATDTSGTLHQAAECQRLGRWLFILRSVVDNPRVTWPARFLAGPKTVVLERTEDLLEKLAAR